MEYYFVLTVSTAIIAVIAGLLWMKTRSISFPLGIAFMYYWSLYGGWSIVIDRLGGDSGKNYGYLEDKLFPIHLDDHYLWSLILYAVFIIVVQIALLLLTKPIRTGKIEYRELIWISHPIILTIATIAGTVSYLLVRSSLLEAWTLGLPGYSTTRFSDSPFYTIHQLLNRAALVPAALGLAVLCSGKDPRRIAGKGGRWVPIGYLVVLAGIFWFNLVIGDRHELLVAGMAGLLFYLANATRPKFVPLAAVAMVAMFGLWIIELLRGVALENFIDAVNSLEITDSASFLLLAVSSNEAFAAHFSMYGALAYNIPLTYGYSFLSLVTSVIPRLFWSDRPPDIYAHYADSIGAIPGQGYTINHATGWYLNFGILGVVMGALVFAWIWACCFNSYVNPRTTHPRWYYVFAALAPWLFVAFIPSLIRGGLEGYKGLLVEGFFIPILGIVFASFRWSLLPSSSVKE